MQNCRVCACAHAREPHFNPSFCCEFLSSIPSPLSLPFESTKIIVFSLKSTLKNSSKNLPPNQKFIFTHKNPCAHRATILSHQARYFLPQHTKNVGDNSKNLPRFSKKVRRFFENLPRYSYLYIVHR